MESKELKVVSLEGARGVKVLNLPVGKRKGEKIHPFTVEQLNYLMQEVYAAGYEDGGKDAIRMIDFITDGFTEDEAAQMVIDEYKLEGHTGGVD